jgi:hypothetical protein
MTLDLPALPPIREEGMLRIFIALKNPSPWLGSNLQPFGPVAITLTTAPPRWLRALLSLYLSSQLKFMWLFCYLNGCPDDEGTVALILGYDFCSAKVGTEFSLCGVFSSHWSLVLQSNVCNVFEILVRMWWPVWLKHTLPHEQRIL